MLPVHLVELAPTLGLNISQTFERPSRFFSYNRTKEPLKWLPKCKIQVLFLICDFYSCWTLLSFELLIDFVQESRISLPQLWPILGQLLNHHQVNSKLQDPFQ